MPKDGAHMTRTHALIHLAGQYAARGNMAPDAVAAFLFYIAASLAVRAAAGDFVMAALAFAAAAWFTSTALSRWSYFRAYDRFAREWERRS